MLILQYFDFLRFKNCAKIWEGFLSVLLFFLLESQHLLYFVICSGHLRNTFITKKHFYQVLVIGILYTIDKMWICGGQGGHSPGQGWVQRDLKPVLGRGFCWYNISSTWHHLLLSMIEVGRRRRTMMTALRSPPPIFHWFSRWIKPTQ